MESRRYSAAEIPQGRDAREEAAGEAGEETHRAGGDGFVGGNGGLGEARGHGVVAERISRQVLGGRTEGGVRGEWIGSRERERKGDRRMSDASFQRRFPIRAKQAESNARDPDAVLGIRNDLRSQKVYTIDSASTTDIDDGISVEIMNHDGDESRQRLRYWIHIADVDRWAPRGSELLRVAERRGTSLYLPTTTLCMFPPKCVHV